MPASGNLSLGINAHVQRDLPFVLAGIGLVKPDGSSRKPDHDRVNEFLNRVTDDLYAEIARRFDPTIDDADLPGTADDAALFQIIPTWREIAWRNAERLASAELRGARAPVAASIEAYAASQAETIRADNGLRPTAEQRRARRLLQHPPRLTDRTHTERRTPQAAAPVSPRLSRCTKP